MKGVSKMKLTNDLYSIIKESKKDKTKAYDTPAEVTRVEDSTLWVHIPGGVDETPIKKTVSAKPGDNVQVRVSGGTAWVVGNATNPPTDDTTAKAAIADAQSAAAAAGSALRSATTAREAAEEAETSADAASAAATRAEGKADDAAAAAETAQKSADGALDSLSLAQDILGVLNWAQDNSSFALTTDTEIEPGKTYWTYNSTTGKYDPVPNPTASALSTYYEISGVDEAMAEFINAHLALTTEGLWILPDGTSGGGFKVLIATGGSGHTYANAGTYIIGGSGPVAYFGSNGIELKGQNFSQVYETFCRIKKDDTFLKAVKYVGSGEVLNYTQTSVIDEDGFDIERTRGSNSVKAFQVTARDPDETSGYNARLLLQATNDDQQRYPDGGSVDIKTGDGDGVTVGYWENGVYNEKVKIDNFGAVYAVDSITSDGPVAGNTVSASQGIFTDAGVDALGDIKSQNGDIEDGSGNVLSAVAAALAGKLTGSAGASGAVGIILGRWKICWGSETMNTNTASGSGTFTAPYYVDKTISLNFSASPYVWAQCQGSLTGTNYVLVTAASATSATMRLMSSHKNTNTRYVRWFAIGQA